MQKISGKKIEDFFLFYPLKINSTQNKSTVDVEPAPLFFLDNTPSTDFTPPIYDIDTKANPNEIMSQVRNIRISGPVSFTNKENHATNEPIFTPDPLLSSTRLNDTAEENGHILVDHNISIPMIHISIDSSCETGAKRKITVTDQASPKPSCSPKVTISTTNDNNNNSKNKNKSVNMPRASKRKADNNVGGEEQPPQKKNTSEVIVLDDTILDVDKDDDDDSVIFVCTEKQKPHEIAAGRNRKKAANYIPINGNSSNQQSVSIYYYNNINRNCASNQFVFFKINQPKSTRAQKRLEKKRLKREKRTPQAKRQQNAKVKSPQSPKKNLRSNLINVPSNRNRFDTKNPTTSFEDRASTAAKSSTIDTESKRVAKNKLVIKREMQEKLFKEKPEFFEKRMIIIDGSNVARSYVLNHRITYHMAQNENILR